MYAQTYTFQFDPSQAGANEEFIQQVVAPDLQQQPDFQGMQLLLDQQHGHAVGISYWGSEAAALAAAERASNPPMPPEGVQVPETRNVAIQTYEVLVDQHTTAD